MPLLDYTLTGRAAQHAQPDGCHVIETDGVQMKKEEEAQDENDRDAGEMSEAEIDKNLEGSFPASDPPSWTLGSNHHSDSKPETESEDEHND